MSKQAVRSILWLALVALLVATPVATAAPPTSPAAPSPAPLAPFDPYILEVIDAQGQAPFYVVLKLQADLSGAAALPAKEAKGRYVYGALTEVAATTQGALLQSLAAEGARYKPYWIRNMVKVWGDEPLLLELAARPDVAEIFYPYPAVAEQATPAAAAPTTVEWNIARVHAPDVWAMGITGEGVVVGDLDTGVQWDHPALKVHYRGCQDPDCTVADHNYNWWDSSAGEPVPLDYGSHGTHTMGTIVGDDGAGNQIGVAPGARWIACAGVDVPDGDPMDCFQFFLAPTRLDGSEPRPDLAPHVINNSWTSSTDYHAIIQTLYAAGIFYAKSGGNTGPNCGTTTNPGQWPEVTATAAFAEGDIIASFSSRGPVTIGHDTVVMKPDVAAPGVNVRSSIPTDTYGPNQGTSMACPHVTGAVALLISANPALAGQIDVLQKILKQTAEPVIDAQCPPYVDHPNDVWGWGILDTYAAVQAAQGISLGSVQGSVTDSVTGAPVAGATLAFRDSSGWDLYAYGAADGSYARALPADTYDVTASAYGYAPRTDPGVSVVPGGTTAHDVALDTLPVWTVSGQVTESGSGLPLAAGIVFEGAPLALESDPATGLYSVRVAEGTYWMDVSSPGHTGASRKITVDSDRTEDFVLDAIWTYPMRSSHDMCDPLAFDWVDATDGTEVKLIDDGNKPVTLPSGRSFDFYGTNYTKVYIGSNGILTFGAGSSLWSGPIPDPAAPNNGIYAFSTNLDPLYGAQGTIYWKYVDSRYFVVEWVQVQHFPSGDPETFEIILDLDTDQVILQYLAVSDPSQAVVGVENSAGTVATQYAYGDPALIADNTRVEFTPVYGTPPLSGPGELVGTVTDEVTGLPIAGASVFGVGQGGGGVFDVTTGEDGTYAVDLCADLYTVSAWATGYEPAPSPTVEVTPGAVTVQDWSLLPILHHRLFLPVVLKNYP